jgi:hypothetical protein
MTRREAHEFIKGYLDNVFHQSNDYDTYSRLRDCVDTLAPPEPDPETGLVPCGCGGVLELHTRPLSFAKRYNNTTDRDIEYQHHVFCRKCHWSTMDYLSKELAIKYANRAMGYREDDEQ